MGAEPRFEEQPQSAIDLTHIERQVLAFVARAAEAGRELESNEEIAHQLDFSGTGTIRGIMIRLERKGHIKTQSYQRGRQVYHEGLKRWTGAPSCTAPHWRDIYDRDVDKTPTLPTAKLHQFPNVMSAVNKLMRDHNMTFANAQVALMSMGVSALAKSGV